MSDAEAVPMLPPPQEADQDQAAKFASLVKHMLEEHERKALEALTRLTALLDILVHDVQGLHLQSAAHGTDIAQLKVRMGKVELDILDLKQMSDDLASR